MKTEYTVGWSTLWRKQGNSVIHMFKPTNLAGPNEIHHCNIDGFKLINNLAAIISTCAVTAFNSKKVKIGVGLSCKRCWGNVFHRKTQTNILSRVFVGEF